MGFGEMVKQNLGVTNKAILEIIDLRDRDVEKQPAVRVDGSAADAALVLDENGNNKDSYMNSGLVNDALNQENKAQKKPVDERINRYTGAKAKYFTVQFNPNSLRLSGHAGGLVRKTSYKTQRRGGSNMEYSAGKTYIEFAVQLFFDAVDPQNAFLADKLALSPTNMITGVVKAGMTSSGDKNNTVQPQVEALIAALRNRHTRLISFHWGDFNYSGVLKSVNATYMMFNITGDPIRATVDLSMTCADSELYPNSLAVWQDRYSKSFGKGSESFVKASQVVGGLLNI